MIRRTPNADSPRTIVWLTIGLYFRWTQRSGWEGILAGPFHTWPTTITYAADTTGNGNEWPLRPRQPEGTYG